MSHTSSHRTALEAHLSQQASPSYSVQVESWLFSECPPTRPPDLGREPPSRKRKRAMSLPAPSQASSHRSGSPKRRRPDDADDVDDVRPEQSASQIGSTVLTLNARNTFKIPSSSASSGVKRSSSPTRETVMTLKQAWPPIITESLSGLENPPPREVKELRDRLAKGVDTAFIPQGLQHIIENDPVIGYQDINLADFDSSDKRSAEQLLDLWQAVKNIFLDARDCMGGNRDENAWCNDVVWPLFQLAIKVHGKGKWWLQSVQSQSINPSYLPTIAAPIPTDRMRRKTIDRKADYILSYSHRDATFADLYRRLAVAGRDEIGHTVDTFTKRTALFSSIEVKATSGDRSEAVLQMSLSIGASILKKLSLAHEAQFALEVTTMVEPSLTIVGHDYLLYYAYPLGDFKDGVHVLGPDLGRVRGIGTDSITGIFKLLRLLENILEFGADDQENGYLGRFFRPLLEKLASNPAQGWC